MLAHGGNSAFLALGGSTHEVSPAAYGVVASWVANLLVDTKAHAKTGLARAVES